MLQCNNYRRLSCSQQVRPVVSKSITRIHTSKSNITFIGAFRAYIGIYQTSDDNEIGAHTLANSLWMRALNQRRMQ